MSAVVVRPARPDELDAAGACVRAAYDAEGLASEHYGAKLADARARDLLILPVCPFFSAYLQKHPDQADVVHPTYRGILGL